MTKINSPRRRRERSNRIELLERKEKGKKKKESGVKIWANWAVNAYQIAHYNWKVDAYARRARAATVRPARILFLRNHNSNSRYRIELHGDCYGRRSMNERTIRKGGSPPVPRIYPLLERASRICSMSDFCSLCDNILNGKSTMIQRIESRLFEAARFLDKGIIG